MQETRDAAYINVCKDATNGLTYKLPLEVSYLI
ncbi:MAG TPA: palindromic element RPE1 domain-containing protein [Rickettsia endosymbiont of Degeeriella rufa]|nr:palindromic element RPE1 domain-containing protein [Rickettsia endosymbiont of Degeeriella rufa]